MGSPAEPRELHVDCNELVRVDLELFDGLALHVLSSSIEYDGDGWAGKPARSAAQNLSLGNIRSVSTQQRANILLSAIKVP